MNLINNKSIVSNQYIDDKNLNIRIMLHQKYSENKQGFSNWIYEKYGDLSGLSVLEIGCGNGDIWKDKNIDKIDKLILTDFSNGMLDSAKSNLKNNNISFKVCDIQNLPFDNNSFDVVIANMMLYHVPDISKGLSEVKRVLKDNGKFYCATFGENSVGRFTAEILDAEDNTNKKFTLQNGKKILEKHFKKIKKEEYADKLIISDIEDMIKYIFSLKDMYTFNVIDENILREKLNKKMHNGVLTVPKEYGIFVSTK